MVELRGELVIDGRPGVPTVERDAGTAVVPLDHALGVTRIDPQVVVVAVRCGNLEERSPTVDRFPALVVEDPHRVGVLWVSENMLVVPGTPLQVAVVTDQLPGRSTIVGPVEPAVLSLDSRPHAPRFRGRYSDPHPAFEALGKARVGGHFRPGIAAVGRLVQT